jgi:hypothetical protein
MSSGHEFSGDDDLIGIGHECSEDDVGQSPFEGTDGCGLVVPGSAASLQEGSGVRVVVRLSHCDPVDRGVELFVAGAAESVT